MGIQSNALLHTLPQYPASPKILLRGLRSSFAGARCHHHVRAPTVRHNLPEKRCLRLKAFFRMAHPAAKFSDTIIVRCGPGQGEGEGWPCACTKVSPRLPPSRLRDPKAHSLVWRHVRTQVPLPHPQGPSRGAFQGCVHLRRTH